MYNICGKLRLYRTDPPIIAVGIRSMTIQQQERIDDKLITDNLWKQSFANNVWTFLWTRRMENKKYKTVQILNIIMGWACSLLRRSDECWLRLRKRWSVRSRRKAASRKTKMVGSIQGWCEEDRLRKEMLRTVWSGEDFLVRPKVNFDPNGPGSESKFMLMVIQDV